jgi:predicted transcriptional regulator
MVKKISISISEELDKTLTDLSEVNNISKSRLIENYLRENPKVILELRQEETQCSLCEKELGRGDVKVSTPRYGVICMSCWIKKQGEIVEESPVTDIKRK